MAIVQNVANINSATPLPASKGGSGVSSPTSGGVLIANGAAAFSSQVLTNGQVLVGSTGLAPVAATLSAGSGISVTNGAGSVTIANTASSSSFSAISGTTQAAVANTRYSAQNAALTTVTLPAAPAAGDRVSVRAYGTGGFSLVCGAVGQKIQMGNQPSAPGGSVDSTSQYDSVDVEAQDSGSSAVWLVTSGVGNLNLV
jgi:hypothetical protein